MTQRRKRFSQSAPRLPVKRFLAFLFSLFIFTALLYLVNNYSPTTFLILFVFFILFLFLFLAVLFILLPNLAPRYLILFSSYLCLILVLRSLRQLHGLGFLLLTLAFLGLYFLLKPRTKK
jgi:drug/metabolite transporter (DMT)-like permease